MEATMSRTKRRLTPEERRERELEALGRAQGGLLPSPTNYGSIYAGFTARGIPADSIQPRVNVLTYHAWRAKGRQVRKGEKGVPVVTWIPCTGKETDKSGNESRVERLRPRTAYVFHESQTDPITE